MNNQYSTFYIASKEYLCIYFSSFLIFYEFVYIFILRIKKEKENAKCKLDSFASYNIIHKKSIINRKIFVPSTVTEGQNIYIQFFWR